uniref:Uncharacterized mitochondrial protein AtMg00810-like n=1 Tax=Tanacetum cinerariifolium TaxID=118510 RepID=A0A699I8X6_TANCI|nr:uncharacterized mitochondrial protein AtMg00810-like [Tanacetum cinerariifolium]
MIGSLMYLTASRPDIMFSVCACARFQVTQKTSHLLAVERIFRYKGKPILGLWYPRDSPFELVAYTDSDYARATQDRKSTTGGCQFLGNRLISWQCKKQTVVATSTTEAEYVAATRNSKDVRTLRKLSLVVPLKKVGDEAVHKELGDRMERAATTASSLEAEQDSEDGNMKITATIDGRIKTITEASIKRHLKLDDSDGITTLPNAEIFEQLALMGVQSLGSVEGSTTLNELTFLCTKLSKRVEDLQSNLQQTKLTYGVVYTKLILRVKKLEHKVKTSQHRRRARVVLSDDEEDLEDPSKQEWKIAEIDENPSIIDPEEPTKLVGDLGSGEKCEKEISTVILEGGYKQSHFKGMSYEDIKLIFERVWDQIHAFVPMNSKIEKEVMKKSGFDLQQKQFAKEVSEKKDDSSRKPVRGTKGCYSRRRRVEYEKEKEELRLSLKIIHNDDSEVNYEPLSRKFPIGDLRMIFDPDENDELWMNQLEWKLLRWKFHENCEVHTLFMDGALMKINMLVEKKYPFIKELLEKMMNLQLEAEEESTMAFELIKSIKSLLEE